jgi:hypothetical protein
MITTLKGWIFPFVSLSHIGKLRLISSRSVVKSEALIPSVNYGISLLWFMSHARPLHVTQIASHGPRITSRNEPFVEVENLTSAKLVAALVNPQQ